MKWTDCINSTLFVYIILEYHYPSCTRETHPNQTSLLTPKSLLTLSPSAKECLWPAGKEGTWLYVCAKCKSPAAAQFPLYLRSPSSFQMTAGLRFLARESSWIHLQDWKSEAFTPRTLPSTCFIHYDTDTCTVCVLSLYVEWDLNWLNDGGLFIKRKHFSFHHVVCRGICIIYI